MRCKVSHRRVLLLRLASRLYVIYKLCVPCVFRRTPLCVVRSPPPAHMSRVCSLTSASQENGKKTKTVRPASRSECKRHRLASCPTLPRITELTFILLSGEELHYPRDAATLTPELLAGQPMIGDVNLFLKGSPGDEDFEAEVEIMIAGAWLRP